MIRFNVLASALVIAAGLASASVGAQQPTPPQAPAAAPASPPTADVNEVPQPPAGMTPGDRKKWFSDRFKQADTNHDGKLTRDEAQAGMPEVYKRFDKIDARKRGYVTERQVGAAWSKMIKDDMQKKNPIVN